MTLRCGRITWEISYPLAGLMAAILILDTSMNVWLCFIAVLMHEGGHLAMLYHCHTPPKHIRLSLFDIAIIDRQPYRHTTKQALTIALAGITVNFITALICFLLWHCTGWAWLPTFITAHLTLGCFNAMPVAALDGGQVLLLLLSCRFAPVTAERILTVISVICLLPMACLGFYLLLVTRYNFTLLLAALYLIALLLLRQKT